MFKHVDYLQFQAKPEKPDALFAAKLQELVGGQFGEMTVMMQYLWQGWNCRVPGKYKDMIMDIATEEIGHVEMLTTMLARLLEGAPNETTEKAQSRLMTSRVYNMTDDRGVKDMLQFNLARDTYHQQQWLLGIEQLIEDGLADSGIENSNGEDEKDFARRTFYSFDPASTAGEGRWAQGPSLLNPEEQLEYVPDAQPLTDDKPLGPAPDPKLYVTYDGSMGKGKPGTGAGAHAQGLANVVNKVKGALD
jgi:Mn-containing catalase